MSGGRLEKRGNSLSKRRTLTDPFASALEEASATPTPGLGDLRFLLPAFKDVPSRSIGDRSPEDESLNLFEPLRAGLVRSAEGVEVSFFFFASIINRSWASSRIARSTSGNRGRMFLKSSLDRTTRRHRVRAMIVAVRGRSINTPISPKNAPGSKSA
jgi:hypothetical protein